MSIVEVGTQDSRAVHHGDRFGYWRFDARFGTPSIDYVRPIGSSGLRYTLVNRYWIRLSELNTKAKLKHWIDHLRTKDFWYEGSNRKDFLRAVQALCVSGYIHRGKHHHVRPTGRKGETV